MKKNKQMKQVVKQIKQAERQSRSDSLANQSSNQDLTYPKSEYFEGIGRRKVASARVRIYKEKADYIVNDQLVADYFRSIPFALRKYTLPFKVTKTLGDFSVTAQVGGSGLAAQLDALVHGIARALLKYDPHLRPFLKKEGLLTRDPRMKETRKPGRGGKARAKRQSPKR